MTQAARTISKHARTCAQIVVLLVACVWVTRDTRIVATNGDPVQYLYAAQSFSEGRGWINATFETPLTQAIVGPAYAPMTVFAPLYPTLLACLGGGLQAAWIVNAVGLCATLCLSYALLRRYDVPASVAVGVCAAFFILMEDPHITFHTALSEPLCIPLALAWAYTLPTHPRRAALFIGLAMLTRYSMLPWLVIHILYLLYRRRLWDTITGVALSCTGIALWILRNWTLTHTATGHALPGDYTGRTWIELGNLLTQWAILLIACGGGAYLVASCVRLWQRISRG